MNTPHIIVREVKTDELSIVRLPVGYTCPADEGYRWAGFFPSLLTAKKALETKSEKVRRQLYGEPRPITGTPERRPCSV